MRWKELVEKLNGGSYQVCLRYESAEPPHSLPVCETTLGILAGQRILWDDVPGHCTIRVNVHERYFTSIPFPVTWSVDTTREEMEVREFVIERRKHRVVESRGVARTSWHVRLPGVHISISLR